jgi:predicted GIY-YIG superfamily endonuclease
MTTLYRCFDAAGALLYVGIADLWARRIGTHSTKTEWFDGVASVTVEHFDTRAQAMAAEAAAIRDESPAWNKPLGPKRKPVDQKCVVAGVSLPVDLLDAAKAKAASARVSFSRYMQALIEYDLKNDVFGQALTQGLKRETA